MIAPLALIEQLEKDHPPRCIGKTQTVEEAHRYAGKVELIATLRAQYEDTLQGDITTADIVAPTGLSAWDQNLIKIVGESQ